MRFVAFILLFFAAVQLTAQETTPAPEGDQPKLFYRSYLSGGASIHSHGYALNFRRGLRKTGFVKHIFEAELASMKHPKEFKSVNPYFDDSRGFVYGKLNTLTVLRPSYGRQRILYTKDAKRGVQISYVLMGGPTLGFVKPVYLEIATSSVPNRISVKTERYDPEEHSLPMIFGRAPALTGLDEISIIPGGQVKFGFQFEYAPEDDAIRALETGIVVDMFYKEVPMMAFTDNRQLFYSFYLNWQFGKKSF